MTKSTITREQLIKKAQEQIEFCRHTKITGEGRVHVNQCAALFEIALAAMDSESNRNPVLAYADSYRDMAKQGVESVPIWSVITDLERNIAPLYRHAQPAPEMKPVGYLFVSEQGAIAYSPTNWVMPGFRLIGQIYGDMSVELPAAPQEVKGEHQIRDEMDMGARITSHRFKV